MAYTIPKDSKFPGAETGILVGGGGGGRVNGGGCYYNTGVTESKPDPVALGKMGELTQREWEMLRELLSRSTMTITWRLLAIGLLSQLFQCRNDLDESVRFGLHSYFKKSKWPSLHSRMWNYKDCT